MKTARDGLFGALLVLLVAACSGTIKDAKGAGGGLGDGSGHNQDGSMAGADGGSGGATGNAGSGGSAGMGGGGNSSLTQCTEEGLLAVSQESLRLNDWQLDNTLRALFPFDVDLDALPDTTTTGANLFSTYPGANEVLITHARDMVDLAEQLALQAAGNLTDLLPCDPAALGERACAEEFVRDFVARAYRRPLAKAEVDDYMSLYDDVRADAADPLDFDLAIAVLVQTALLTPDTMYLVERGEPSGEDGVLVLTGREIANRISYLFWNAPPDADLIARADADELRDATARIQEAERLFDDARSEQTVERFVGEWFGVADEIFVDHAAMPLAQAWEEETRRFARMVVYGGGVVGDLLDSDETYVNQPLAEHYGLGSNVSSGENDWQRVSLPAERRGGLLTTAQFAAATSHNNTTSLVHRGKAVRERLLCGELGIPDPAFLDMNPVLPADATVREKMEARMAIQPCGGCHSLMDPIGIGMDDMDENGLFRTQYANGQDVDSMGEILGVSGLTPEFSGIVDLAHTLAGSEQLQQCAADQWLRYAVGRKRLGTNENCYIERILDDAMARGGTLRDLMVAVVASDAFIYRVAEP